MNIWIMCKLPGQQHPWICHIPSKPRRLFRIYSPSPGWPAIKKLICFFWGGWHGSFMISWICCVGASMCIVLWVASLKSCMSFKYPIQTPWSFSSFSGQSCNGLAIDNETPEDSRLVNSDFGYQGLVSEVKPLGQFRPSRLKENPTESRRNFKLLENGWNTLRWESTVYRTFEFFQCNKTCKNTANPIIGWWLGHRVFFLSLLVSWPVCSQIDANVSQTSYLHYLASSVSRNMEHLAAGPHWGMATSGELRIGVFNEKDCIVKDVLHSDISLPNCYTSCAISDELL